MSEQEPDRLDLDAAADWEALAKVLDEHWFTTKRRDAGAREPGCKCGQRQAEDNHNARRHADHLADAILASPWLAAHVAAAVAERDAELERLRVALRCDSRHPEVDNAVPCHLDKGHDGEHISTTGCAGSVLRWPSALYVACTERDEARAVLGAVAALADEWEAECSPVSGDCTPDRHHRRLRAVLAPVSGAVEGAGALDWEAISERVAAQRFSDDDGNDVGTMPRGHALAAVALIRGAVERAPGYEHFTASPVAEHEQEVRDDVAETGAPHVSEQMIPFGRTSRTMPESATLISDLADVIAGDWVHLMYRTVAGSWCDTEGYAASLWSQPDNKTLYVGPHRIRERDGSARVWPKFQLAFRPTLAAKEVDHG